MPNDTLVASMPHLGIDYQQLLVPAKKAGHPEGLVAELAQVKGMEPRPDDLGNVQAVFRLDWETDKDGAPTGALILTFPAKVDAAAVAKVVKAHDPNPPALAQAQDPLLGALDKIDVAKLKTPGDVIAALKKALQ